MTVHIGFTGTQNGMTSPQIMAAVHLVERLGATDLHHGSCVGADEELHRGVMFGGLDHLRIHSHPSTLWAKRAECYLREGLDIPYGAKPPLERNRDIVDACEALIAAPKESAETLRSGTWATIRYCRKVGKPVLIVWPDGTVSEEKPNG